MLHEQILLDGRRRDLDMEILILDKDIASISLNKFTHNGWPCSDEAVLIVRSFNTIQPQKLLHDIAYLFRIASPHD